MNSIAHSNDDFSSPEAPPRRRANGFHARLRKATRLRHDEVDALFGTFDLADRESYAAFLIAHAMALMPVEDWADIGRLVPGWAGRKVPLYEDLASLRIPMPKFASLNWPREEAARWGAAYVLEGSRLGGAVLARRVGQDLPHAYLAAKHPAGGWQALLRAIEARAELGGEAWQSSAIASADRTFDLYADAARRMIAR